MRCLSPRHLYPGGACVCVHAHTGSGEQAGGGGEEGLGVQGLQF